jgi:hypothetical protein
MHCPECKVELHVSKPAHEQHRPGCAVAEAMKQISVSQIDLHKINPATPS